MAATAPSLPSFLRVEAVAGKGRGVVAALAVSAGTFLFTERPLTSSPFRPMSAQQLTPEAVLEELALIALADPSGAYERLCHHVAEHDASALRASPSPLYSDAQFTVALSRVRSNAFAAEVTAEEAQLWAERNAGSGARDEGLRVLTLYAHLSMVNHCCSPNAAVHWGEGSGEVEREGLKASASAPRVYAIADIGAGEEVCIAYRADLLHFPTELRRALIERSWSFACTCARCTTPAAFPEEQRMLALTKALSDEQRQRMLTDFAALTAYADERQSQSQSQSQSLSAATPTSSSLHPVMARRLTAFWALPLGVAHWRRHRLRELFLPSVLAQPSVPYAEKRRLVEEHVLSNALVLPQLHPHKLSALLTLASLLRQAEPAPLSDADVEATLLRHEPHAAVILSMYNAYEDGG